MNRLRDRQRITHVISGLSTGGAERLLVDLAEYSRHDICVISLTRGGLLRDELASQGIPVFDVNMRSNRDVSAIFRLARLIRKSRPDVVHVHLYRALIYGRLAARLVGVRSILATEHSALPNVMERRHAGRGVKLLYRGAERLGRRTVAVSDDTKKILVDHWGVPPSRIHVIPNGIRLARRDESAAARPATRARLGLQQGVPTIVYVGRLADGKNVGTLIDVVALARNDGDEWALILVGSGEERAQLDEHVRHKGLVEKVHFIGEVADVSPYLAAADAFASASALETYGIALVEAVASGLPAAYVAAPAGDLLRELGSERLVKCSATAESLYEGLRRAFSLTFIPEPLSMAQRQAVDIRETVRALDDLADAISSRRNG